MKYSGLIFFLLLASITCFGQYNDCSGGSKCIPRTVTGFTPDGREVFLWLCAHSGLYLQGDYYDTVNSYERKDSALNIVCGNPVYSGKVEFIFTNGDKYVYEMDELYATGRYRHAAFKALLHGTIEVSKRHRHFGKNEKREVHGDELLLVRLACHPLKQINFNPYAWYADRGRLRQVIQAPVVIRINEEDATLLRDDLRCMVGIE